MELHVWCPLGGAPSLDPSCLAAVWAATLSGKDVSIVPSSNVHLSPTGMLPVLLQDEAIPISGFIEIAEVLLGDTVLSSQEIALLAYLQRLSVTTQWVLFVNKPNYETVTRPEISAEIPFPMQYNAALLLHREAVANQGGAAADRAANKAKDQSEAVSKLHAQMLAKMNEREIARDLPKAAIRRMSLLDETLKVALPLLKDSPEQSPARLLLAANLVLVSLVRLPEKPLEPIILQYSEAVALRDWGRALNYRVHRMVPVSSDKAYSLTNVVKAYTGYALGW